MIDKKAKKFLKELLKKPGLPGYELPAQNTWRNYVKNYSDDVISDYYYNAIASLNPGGHPKIMLIAHIDQIGLMVSYIDEKGFIYLRSLGYTYPNSLLSREVYIMTVKHGNIPGIIGFPEELYKDEGNKLTLNKLWVDIGAETVEEVREKVKVGDYVVIKGEPFEIGNNCLVSPGLDDRIGCFAIAEVLKELYGKKLKPAILAVTSVQEEVNSLGAKLKSEELKPDIAIIVDIELASDSPGIDKTKKPDISLRKGPVISRGLCNNRFISQRLMEIAEENSIPYQLYPDNTSNTTDLFTVVKSGVLACVITIPTRYYHTSVEMLDFLDVENTIKLIKEFILSFNKDPHDWLDKL
ncbi:MAG TPA: hypothetical protein PL110_13105 [Candidatus Eremiobacteraeota bacterium]|nr:MAG: putative aminopeptidase YsdC [bacterium ADurb.Bin363]HPZ09050.1 hypothetical protein [Candidatus Eremiobacteraeota bacterium]